MTEIPTPTPRELEILGILWNRGEATVREVADIMRADEDLAQNTVQTFLRVMEEKGLSGTYQPRPRICVSADLWPRTVGARLFGPCFRRCRRSNGDEFTAC